MLLPAGLQPPQLGFQLARCSCCRRRSVQLLWLARGPGEGSYMLLQQLQQFSPKHRPADGVSGSDSAQGSWAQQLGEHNIRALRAACRRAQKCLCRQGAGGANEWGKRAGQTSGAHI